MCWNEQQWLVEDRKHGGDGWWQKGDDALGITESTGGSYALQWLAKRSRGRHEKFASSCLCRRKSHG